VKWSHTNVHVEFRVPTGSAVGRGLIVLDCGQLSNATAALTIEK
jgi:hypothetical protein